jgi:hypothetical protein
MDRTARIRKLRDKSAGTGSRDRAGGTGQVERTVGTGQQWQAAMVGKIVRAGYKDKKGQLGQKNQDRTTIAGQQGEEDKRGSTAIMGQASYCKTSRTG